MPAYWVARVKVIDTEKYQEYTQLAAVALKKYGARVLARTDSPFVLEGDVAESDAQFNRSVIIEFADLKTAQQCHRSPEYQRAKQARTHAAVVESWIIYP
ncbi:MAG: DUF1330 domain-containing protein [Cellvibrionaceae bacterium]|nr:DUF1330 domain-containing protein [Cellvibrionaceae bacterium]